jgi:BirA family biotin operon repressor/biotin-[acetyl-CoA-carboxylase] ligase
MLSEERLRRRLPASGLGEQLFFHHEVGSTNDVAHELAKQGAPHGTLVVAESQTHGRGQRGRQWITRAGRGLAISVILHPNQGIPDLWTWLHALSALSVVQALEWFQLSPEIKWPNDILLDNQKVAGILVEISWIGDLAEYIILGIGINIAPNPVPPTVPLEIPAISIEDVLGYPIDACDLVEQLLHRMGSQLSVAKPGDLIENWGKRLAYLGKDVLLESPEQAYSGIFLGINQKGMIELQVQEDQVQEIGIGDYRMRLKA